MKLTREEIIKMKRYQLNKKEDYIIYLNEIIGRTKIGIMKYERYISKMEQYIKNNITDEITTISNNDYTEFSDLIGNCDSYICNLIGDHQQTSISYVKFREIIKKKTQKGQINFKIRDLDEEIEEELRHINRNRNWLNHVPESLLTSKQKLIEDGEIAPININPIVVHTYEQCSVNMFMDLYYQSIGNLIIIKGIFKSMQKDYSDLIGESMRIFTQSSKQVNDLWRTSDTRISASIQGLGNDISDI